MFYIFCYCFVTIVMPQCYFLQGPVWLKTVRRAKAILSKSRSPETPNPRITQARAHKQTNAYTHIHQHKYKITHKHTSVYKHIFLHGHGNTRAKVILSKQRSPETPNRRRRRHTQCPRKWASIETYFAFLPQAISDTLWLCCNPKTKTFNYTSSPVFP